MTNTTGKAITLVRNLVEAAHRHAFLVDAHNIDKADKELKRAVRAVLFALTGKRATEKQVEEAMNAMEQS